MKINNEGAHAHTHTGGEEAWSTVHGAARRSRVRQEGILESPVAVLPLIRSHRNGLGVFVVGYFSVKPWET
jgi:hypothetical protein